MVNANCDSLDSSDEQDKIWATTRVAPAGPASQFEFRTMPTLCGALSPQIVFSIGCAVHSLDIRYPRPVRLWASHHTYADPNADSDGNSRPDHWAEAARHRYADSLHAGADSYPDSNAHTDLLHDPVR